MRKKITTIFSIFFKQKNTRLDAPVAVFVEIQQITEARGRGLLQEPEGDALAVKIHGKHCDHYLLMEFQHLGRVIHTTARKAHLGDVYEAVLLDAYVHESSEGGDIGHYSREFHSGFQILYGMHIGCELKLAGSLPRVPSRFHQLLEYVVDGLTCKVPCLSYPKIL